MEKELARTIMEELVKCHEALDKAEVACRDIPDKEERDEYIKAILEAGGHIYTETMFRIILQHPELNPYPSNKKE